MRLWNIYSKRRNALLSHDTYIHTSFSFVMPDSTRLDSTHSRFEIAEAYLLISIFKNRKSPSISPSALVYWRKSSISKILEQSSVNSGLLLSSPSISRRASSPVSSGFSYRFVEPGAPTSAFVKVIALCVRSCLLRDRLRSRRMVK